MRCTVRLSIVKLSHYFGYSQAENASQTEKRINATTFHNNRWYDVCNLTYSRLATPTAASGSYKIAYYITVIIIQYVSLRCCRMLGVVSHYISFLCHLHAINAYSIKDTACMYKRI